MGNGEKNSSLKLVPGTVIAGKFRLEEPLAQGGMGAVFRAVHMQLRASVAIKFMSPTAAASPAARARFEREARASAQLQHLNIVSVQDFGIEGDTPYIVMEYLRGESLEQRILRKTRFALTVLTPIVTQIARGLRKAHEAGVIHRDLKPGNIFLAATDDDEETVKILDFGIAKDTAISVDSSTKTGEFIGSPHYMSPEQIQDAREIDYRSDLWSLGVIVYRCVTGVLPFPGDTLGAILGRVLTAPIPPPSKHVPRLPPNVDAFFVRALARDREQRFQTAREFAEAFAALSGMEATVRKATLAPWTGQDSAMLSRELHGPAAAAPPFSNTQTPAAAPAATATPFPAAPPPQNPPALGTGNYPVAPAAQAYVSGAYAQPAQLPGSAAMAAVSALPPPPAAETAQPVMQTVPLMPTKGGKTIKMKPLAGPAPDPGPPKDVFAGLLPAQTVPMSTPIAQVNPGTLTGAPSAGDAALFPEPGKPRPGSLREQWKTVPIALRLAAIIGLALFFIVLTVVIFTPSEKPSEVAALGTPGETAAPAESMAATAVEAPGATPAETAQPVGSEAQTEEKAAPGGQTQDDGQALGSSGDARPRAGGGSVPQEASKPGAKVTDKSDVEAKSSDQGVIAIRAKGGACKTVSVKGKALGSTPINLNVAPGNYTIYCRTEAGATKSGSVSVSAGQSKTIVFNLK